MRVVHLGRTWAEQCAALIRVLGHGGAFHKGQFISAGLTAVAFFSGALSSLANGSLFLSSTGAPDIVARLVPTFALIQVGLGGSFLYVALLASRGRWLLSRGPVWHPDLVFAWVSLVVLLGLFCLNPIAVLFSLTFFAQFPIQEDPFEYAGRPGCIASLEAYRRSLRELAMSVRMGHPPQMILTGQTLCSQCSLPNAAERRRCRVCGSRLVGSSASAA